MGIRKAETLAIPFFQNQVLPDFRGDALQMEGVYRQAPLVGFSGAGNDAEGKVLCHAGHFFLGLVDLAAFSKVLGGATAALLSARFSLMDLLDFLDAA